MADPILEFDPAGEASGSPLTITTGNYGLTAFSAPAPPPRYQWASSVDTEGASLASRGHENRMISISLDVMGDQAVYDLQQKLSKLHREGGTLKYTTPAAIVVTFDVLAQEGFDPAFNEVHYLGGLTQLSFSLPCKPYGRGAEVDLGDNVETTLPALVFTEASVGGDVPALGRLVIDDDSAADQWWLTWGLQSRYYSSSANAALFYEAEGRTALGGSAIAAGPSGASGAGSNVMRNTALTTSYLAIMSTQATAAGAHLSHVGTFRVYARMQVPTANTGFVTTALEWSEGDFRRVTRNASVALYPQDAPDFVALGATVGGIWRLVDLGLVTLSSVTAGTQRWEGRVLAKSTIAGDDIDVDWLMLVPVDEGSGVVSTVIPSASATAFSARDEFNQAAGALVGKTSAVGGVWAGGGDADDFAVETTGKTAQRATVTDTNPRLDWTPTSLTATAVQADVKNGGALDGRMGVVARVVDASNYLAAYLYWATAAQSSLVVIKVVAGTGTVLNFRLTGPHQYSSYYTVRLVVDAAGRFAAGYARQGQEITEYLVQGQRHGARDGRRISSGEHGHLRREHQRQRRHPQHRQLRSVGANH